MKNEINLANYNKGCFSFFKTGLVGKPLTLFDWIIFLVIAVFCLFVYCHQDICNTGSSSFTYLIGHFFDFYDYNYINQVEPMNNYMPSTYLMFAIWNLPLFLLGIKRLPTGGVPFIGLMWFKLLPIVFFLASGLVLYKIGNLIGFGEKKSKILTYVFLTSPVAFFGPVIFGQYDTFTVFFALLGFFYYLKNDDFKFVLFFSIAVTFKYFALILFLPLLLLKEKNVFKILKQCVLFIMPFLFECLLYIKSPMFHKGVFSFAAKNNLFLACFDLGFSRISLFLVIWTIILCYCYYLNIDVKNSQKFFNWAIYISNFITSVVFAIIIWHPQWLIFAIAFTTINTFLNKNPKLFFLIDFFMFAILIAFSSIAWQNGVDQHMLSKGIFKKLMSPVDVNYGIPVTMCSFFKFFDKNFYFSVISALFIVNLILKHPKFCFNEIDCSFEKIVQCWTVIRMRFLSVLFCWIIPTLLCLIMSMFSPFYILKNSEAFRGSSILVDEKNLVASQIFVPNDEFELTNLEILMARSNAIVEESSNTTLQRAQILISLSCESDGENQLFEKSYDIVPPTFMRPIMFSIDKTLLESNKVYRLNVSINPAKLGCGVYIGKTFGRFNNSNYAILNENPQGFSFCFDLLGRKPKNIEIKN